MAVKIDPPKSVQRQWSFTNKMNSPLPCEYHIVLDMDCFCILNCCFLLHDIDFCTSVLHKGHFLFRCFTLKMPAHCSCAQTSCTINDFFFCFCNPTQHGTDKNTHLHKCGPVTLCFLVSGCSNCAARWSAASAKLTILSQLFLCWTISSRSREICTTSPVKWTHSCLKWPRW